MPVMNKRDAYGGVAIFLHWLLFLMIAGLVVSGKFTDSLPAPKGQIIGVHKQVGVAVFLLMAFRLLWRLINTRVESLNENKLLRLLAFVVHWLLYLVVLLQALTGVLSSQLAGRAVTFLGNDIPLLVGQGGLLLEKFPALPFLAQNSRIQAEQFHSLHHLGGTAILVLIGLHFLGVIVQVLRRDETLRRMWFGYTPYYAKDFSKKRKR